MHNVSIQVNGNKLSGWNRDFGEKSVRGWSTYDVIVQRSDRTRSFFCHKLCKGCPISYTKNQRDPPRASVATSEKLMAGCITPPRILPFPDGALDFSSPDGEGLSPLPSPSISASWNPNEWRKRCFKTRQIHYKGISLFSAQANIEITEALKNWDHQRPCKFKFAQFKGLFGICLQTWALS